MPIVLFSIEKLNLGLRSGEITPKSLTSSRPGSAMSTSTTNSSVNRRTTPVRKAQRPLSIHVTGVSKEGIYVIILYPKKKSLKTLQRAYNAFKKIHN